MKPIDYFKLQSKNLFKDFQTQTSHYDETLGGNDYAYNPKYFDIVGIILHFDFNEEEFSLMRAQHVIAQLAGFVKWTEMLQASETELELAKLLFDNQHKISYEEWKYYLMGAEYDNDMNFDPETRLDIFKTVFANEEGHQTQFQDFRINPNL